MVKNVGNPAVSQLLSEFYNQPSGLLHEQGRRPDFVTGPGEHLSKTTGPGWRLLSGARTITSAQNKQLRTPEKLKPVELRNIEKYFRKV